jgi:CIC family chloride channel protein
MIVSVMSYLIAKWFSPISPELKSLADEGKIFTNKHDKNLLFALRTDDFIDKYSQTINENASISELFELVKNGNKNIFAVVDDNRKLKGILTLDDIRPYLFNKETDPAQTLIQVMKAPPAILHREDKPLEILQTFDDTGVWNLPVVSEANDFIGFISKSSILMSYRQL